MIERRTDGATSRGLIELTARIATVLRVAIHHELPIARDFVTGEEFSIAGKATGGSQTKQRKNPIESLAVKGITRMAFATRASII
jgi:hypothetical protein